MVAHDPQGRMWRQRADLADAIRQRAAEDRILDDVSRYEPTPTTQGPSDNAVFGALCLLAVVVLIVAAGIFVAARWAVGG